MTLGLGIMAGTAALSWVTAATLDYRRFAGGRELTSDDVARALNGEFWKSVGIDKEGTCVYPAEGKTIKLLYRHTPSSLLDFILLKAESSEKTIIETPDVSRARCRAGDDGIENLNQRAEKLADSPAMRRTFEGMPTGKGAIIVMKNPPEKKEGFFHSILSR